jgi:hypothetical protein
VKRLAVGGMAAAGRGSNSHTEKNDISGGLENIIMMKNERK